MPESPAESLPDAPAKFYLTTPIYYVNARPHIGHAYTTIVADVIARRHRLLGDDTFFVTGTDEHGQKIERSAAAAGIPPQQFADTVSQSFRDLWDRMGITYTDFIRTTEPRHKTGVQKLFQTLQDRGHIYLSTYTGQYCVSDEAYVDGPPGVRCPDCGRVTETVSESNYYFKLSAFQLPLLNLIESNQLLITPDSRRNEVLSFLRGNVEEAIHGLRFDAIWNSEAVSEEEAYKMAFERRLIQKSAPSERFPSGHLYVPGALKDLSISRTSFKWGIPVPGHEDHVIYVWLDALANYMTAIGYGSEAPEDVAKFERFWPADLHLVGKEIIRFHCVYWPAFLLALNPLFSEAHEQPTNSNAVILSEAKNPESAALTETAEPLSATEPGAPPSRGTSRKGGVSSEARPPSSTTPELSPEDHKAWAKKMLPKAITAHGWLLFEDSKMSKSKGNIVRTETILDTFGTLCPPSAIRLPQQNSVILSGAQSAQSKNPEELTPPTTADTIQPPTSEASNHPTPHDRDLFATDILRYFLLREIPFGQDGSFSFDAMITRYNADLANGYGNLVSRVLKLVEQHLPDGWIAPEEPWLYPKMVENTTSEEESAASTAVIWDRSLDLIEHLHDVWWPDYAFEGALSQIMAHIGHVDAYLSIHKPWALAKSQGSQARRRLIEVLYTASEAIRTITIALHPFLPFATARVWNQLGLGDIEEAAESWAQLGIGRSEDPAFEGKLGPLQWGGLQPGTKLGPLSPIFPRADKGLAQIMADIEQNPTNVTAHHDATPAEKPEFPEAPLSSASTKPAPSKLTNETTTATPETPLDPTDPAAPPRSGSFAESNPITQVGGSASPTAQLHKPPTHTEAQASGPFASAQSSQPIAHSSSANQPSPAAANQITIDDFAKVELRVAKILVCERIPKADKLLRLEVDLGYEKRQILSGIAEWYTPEDLIGRKIVVITNLAPRKMRGLESHGMLLAASSGEDGKPALATFADSDNIEVGARLK